MRDPTVASTVRQDPTPEALGSAPRPREFATARSTCGRRIIGTSLGERGRRWSRRTRTGRPRPRDCGGANLFHPDTRSQPSWRRRTSDCCVRSVGNTGNALRATCPTRRARSTVPTATRADGSRSSPGQNTTSGRCARCSRTSLQPTRRRPNPTRAIPSDRRFPSPLPFPFECRVREPALRTDLRVGLIEPDRGLDVGRLRERTVESVVDVRIGRLRFGMKESHANTGDPVDEHRHPSGERSVFPVSFTIVPPGETVTHRVLTASTQGAC